MHTSERRIPRGLIVDDHDLVRMVTGSLLEHLGYEVAGFATNGSEAVEQIQGCHPDFVLMDLAMPLVDGIAATRLIRTESEIPVVICSGETSPELVREALQAGANAVVEKPCPSTRLADVLNGIFRE